MAKILGIDYGTKRVGVAMSDETGTLAFPRAVLINNKELLTHIKSFCEEEGVMAVVLGESRDFKGLYNTVTDEIMTFKKKLENKVDLPVHFQEEFLTSYEARKVEYSSELRDAHAAAFILQRYLDKNTA